MQDLGAIRQPPVITPPPISWRTLADLAIRLLPLLALGLIVASAQGYLKSSGVIDAGSIQPWQQGEAYYVASVAAVMKNPCGLAVLCPMPSDASDTPSRSSLVLLENGVPLGPAHVAHADIARLGAGRYSHWNGALVFSASDASDPRTNRRLYTVEDSPRVQPLVSICFLLLGAMIGIRQRRGLAAGLPELRWVAQGLHTAGISLGSLLGACRLVGRAALPVALMTAALCGVAYVAAIGDPERGFFMPSASIDVLILKTQRDRAAELPTVDIAFVGDSSCLMGIDASLLGATLSRSVESYCSVAFLGPRGYARQISAMLSRGHTPGRLVLVFNPVGFARKPEWDSWLAMLAAGPALPDSASAVWLLDYARRKWVDKAIYRPLPGNYALYYGGAYQVERALKTGRGSMIDPGSGLDKPSPTAFQGATSDCQRAAAQKPGSIEPNNAFWDAMKELAAAIARIGADRTYVIVTPIPDTEYCGAAVASLTASRREIGEALGIKADHLLKTAPAMPLSGFSTDAHLNRWGRATYTRELAKQLRAGL